MYNPARSREAPSAWEKWPEFVVGHQRYPSFFSPNTIKWIFLYKITRYSYLILFCKLFFFYFFHRAICQPFYYPKIPSNEFVFTKLPAIYTLYVYLSFYISSTEPYVNLYASKTIYWKQQSRNEWISSFAHKSTVIRVAVITEMFAEYYPVHNDVWNPRKTSASWLYKYRPKKKYIKVYKLVGPFPFHWLY